MESRSMEPQETTVIFGKGNLLDAIRKTDPSLPGEYIRIRGDDPDRVKIANSYMLENQGDTAVKYILRSDATCEDSAYVAKIANFPGVFRSIKEIQIDGLGQGGRIDEAMRYIQEPLESAKKDISQLESELERVVDNLNQASDAGLQYSIWSKLVANKQLLQKAIKIKEYALSRHIDIIDARMDFILHRQYDGMLCMIAEHPNIADLYHVEIQSHKGDWSSHDIDIRSMTGGMGPGPILGPRPAECIREMRKAGKLHPGLAYVGEVIISDDGNDYLVQLRPYFRRKLYDTARPDLLVQFDLNKGLEFDYKDLRGNCGIKHFNFEACYDVRTALIDMLEFSLLQNQHNIILSKRQHSKYLSHPGLRVLELVDCVDLTEELDNYDLSHGFDRKNPPKTVRYSIDEKGFPRIDAVM